MGQVRLALASLALAAWLLTGVAPVAALGADVATFGTPTTEGSFGKEIVFRQPVTLTGALDRVELLVTFADALGPTIVDVPPPSATGAVTLTYTMSVSGDGHILPNTPLRSSWRVRASGDHGVIQTGPTDEFVYADSRFDWKTRVGPIVRVHWYQGDDAFGERALTIGEDAIESSGKLLGVTETEPVDFFVYADRDQFYDALGPGTRENVGGQADADIRTLFALITPSQIGDSWVGVVIPHELTHLVFNTAVDNPYHFPPRWLNEGLAVYQSEGYPASDRRDVARAAKDGTLTPLTGLTGQFPTSSDGFSLAYSESVSAVDYLIRSDGKDALVGLVRSYANGLTDDEAFKAAIGLDVQGFSDAWLADLGATVPKRLGPEPAPPGPVPPGWDGGGDGNAPQPSNAHPGGSVAVPSTRPSTPLPTVTAVTEPADATAAVGLLAIGLVLIGIGVAAYVAYRRRGAES